jgi:hypothetical protein
MTKYICIKDCNTKGINSVNLNKGLCYYIDPYNSYSISPEIYSIDNKYYGYILYEELSNFITLAEWRQQQINLILDGTE